MPLSPDIVTRLQQFGMADTDEAAQTIVRLRQEVQRMHRRIEMLEIKNTVLIEQAPIRIPHEGLVS